MAALLMVGMTTFAQEGKPMRQGDTKRERMTPEQREQQQLKKMSADLNLDAAQQKELEKILADGSKHREEQRQDMKDERDKKRAENDKFREEQDAKITKLLRADQKEKWAKMKEEQKARMEQRKQKRDNAPKPE